MAVLDSLINHIPGVAASLAFVRDLAILGGGVVSAGMALAWFKRLQMRAGVALEAHARGLSDESACFLGKLLWREGSDEARELLRSPEALQTRLAQELSRFRYQDSAVRFAEQAGALMSELRLRTPLCNRAPLLFERVHLVDPADQDGAPLTAFVVGVDEENITLTSPNRCPWPVRHQLALRHTEGCQSHVDVTLILRPMPGNREWVLGHDLLGDQPDRRRAERRPCSIEAWALPTTAGAYTLRGRLQEGEELERCALERLESWDRRFRVVIEDISGDGARLSADSEIQRGDHFYLVLPREDGALAALPLTEVVSVRTEDDGKSVLGTRFCAVRMKERMVLADYAAEATPAN